jgi:hypothetical protein
MKPDPSTSNNILLNNPITTSGTVSAGPAQDDVSEHNVDDTLK